MVGSGVNSKRTSRERLMIVALIAAAIMVPIRCNYGGTVALIVAA